MMKSEDMKKGLVGSAMDGPAEEQAEGPAGDNPLEEKAEQALPLAQSEKGDEQAPGEGKPNVTEDEQLMYDSLMAAALKMVYGEKQLPVLLHKMVAGKDNESHAIGSAAANIMRVINRSAVQSNKGQPIDDSILYEVGLDVVAEMVDIAIMSGIVPPENRDMLSEAATYEGMRAYGMAMEQDGDVTPDVKRAYSETLAARGIKQEMPQQAQQPQAPAAPAAPAPQGAPAPGIVNQAAGA